MKTAWKDDKVNVKELELDLQNPRVPKHVKEEDDVEKVRHYLLEKEGVMRIAKSIANNGYHRSAIAIVCEEDGKLVVLDGNRRLAACQLLLDPNLATDVRYKKELESLSKKVDKSEFEKIKITIAPSRKEAENEIWDIHVNQLSRPWQLLQKLRMYRNLIDNGDYDVQRASEEYGVSQAKFKKELAKLYFHEQILERVEKSEEEDELLKAGFNKIDRLILSNNGKKLFGYEIDGRGNIIATNTKKFQEKLDKILPFVVIPGKVNAQASQEDLEDSVYPEIDAILFPKKKSNSPIKGTFELKKLTKVPGTLAKRDWVTSDEYKAYSGADKVKQILKEVKDLDPTEYKVVLVVALRVLLESALYYKLEEKEHISRMEKNYKSSIKVKNLTRAQKGQALISPQKNWSPSFREMLDYSLEESNGAITSPQARDALSRVIKGETNFVEDLNSFIHNAHRVPTSSKPEEIWSAFGRLLLEIISKIQ